MAKRASKQPRGGGSGPNGRWARQQAAEALRGYGKAGGGTRGRGAKALATPPRERQPEAPRTPIKPSTKTVAKRSKPASKPSPIKVTSIKVTPIKAAPIKVAPIKVASIAIAPVAQAPSSCLLLATHPLPMVIERERAAPERHPQEMPVILLPDLSEPLVVGVVAVESRPSAPEVVVRDAIEASLILAAPRPEAVAMAPIARARALTAPVKGLRAAIGDWLRSAGRLLRAGLVNRRPDPLPRARQRLAKRPSGPAAPPHPGDPARD